MLDVSAALNYEATAVVVFTGHKSLQISDVMFLCIVDIMTSKSVRFRVNYFAPHEDKFERQR